MRAIRAETCRALRTKGFLIGALGMAAAVLTGALEGLIELNWAVVPRGTCANILSGALGSDFVAMASPILCTLPFSSAFVEDACSGFVRQLLPRSGNDAYIVGKVIACAASGGLALAAGLLAACALMIMTFLPIEPGFAAQIPAQIVDTLQAALLFFLAGALGSLVGMGAAALAKNRAVTHAAPFIGNYILIILYERYSCLPYCLYPPELLRPSSAWGAGIWGAALLMLEGALIAGLLFYLFERRRLCHGSTA